MSDFTPTSFITLRPYTNPATYTFTFTVCSSAGSNDGWLSYGDGLSTCTPKVYDADDDDVTSEVIADSSLADNVVTIEFQYPSTSGDGVYVLRLQYETTLGDKDEAVFKRIQAVSD